MFRNREDAARRLAERLKGRRLTRPVVLAIPRGGLVTGTVLARELGAELDVALARKLRAPGQAGLALGAVAEDGHIYLAPHAALLRDTYGGYLDQEVDFQLGEIARLRRLFRGSGPPAVLRDRSVIVADDGLLSGSTLIAALRFAREQMPHELIAAVPVAAAEGIEAARRRCDELVYLDAVETCAWLGRFYEDFPTVSEEEAVALFHGAAPLAVTA
jgi:predicted phosphoribosyltransferase